MIKHIFSDMDGTLLNTKGEIPEKTSRVLQKQPLPLTLVSARAPMEMQAAIERLGLQGPQIAFNGGLIFQNNQVLVEYPINYLLAKFLILRISSCYPEISLSYYTLHQWYTEKIDAGIDMEVDLTHQKPLVIPLSEYFKCPRKIFKIMLIIFDDETMKNLKNALEALHIAGIIIQQSGQFYLEITSNKAKKSTSMAFILSRESLKKSEIVAFGDGHNDLPLLKGAGLPIAMENAQEEVKAVAQFITKSNDENGVAYALTHLIKQDLAKE